MIDPNVTGVMTDVHRMIFLDDKIYFWGEFNDGSTTYYGLGYHDIVSDKTSSKQLETKAKSYCTSHALDYNELVTEWNEKKAIAEGTGNTDPGPGPGPGPTSIGAIVSNKK